MIDMLLSLSIVPITIDPEDIVKLNMFIVLIKYAFYSIWIVPAYRAIVTFKSWKKNYQAYTAYPLHKDATVIKNKWPKVSIVIPARNSEKYIRASVLSAVNQSFLPTSIFVLNDASTDKTAEKVRSLIEELNGKLLEVSIRDNYVMSSYKLRRSDSKELELNLVTFAAHSGKPKMINTVLPILKEKADYMLVLDSDTVIEKHYLSKLISFVLKDTSIVGANGTVLLWQPEGNGKAAWFFAKAFRNLASLYYLLTLRFSETVFKSVNSLNGSCALYKVGSVLEVGGFPEDTYVEDTSMSWELQFRMYNVAYVPNAFSFTVDPSNPKRYFSKILRITLGVQKLFFSRLPKLIKGKNKNLLLTSAYTSFGSLPFVFVIVNVFLSTAIASLGIYSGGITNYLYGVLQYTPFALILIPFIKYPLTNLLFSYVTGIFEAYLILIFLRRLYRKDHTIKFALEKSKKSVFIVPAILWIQAFFALIAIPISLYHVIAKKKISKW